jgi:hypothetical protein
MQALCAQRVYRLLLTGNETKARTTSLPLEQESAQWEPRQLWDLPPQQGFAAGVVARGFAAGVVARGFAAGVVAQGFAAGVVARGFAAGVVAQGFAAGVVAQASLLA